MRSAALLLLLFILALSDVQSHRIIDPFDSFSKKHIIQTKFNTGNKNNWMNLFSPRQRDLCGGIISFIQGSSGSIKNICINAGIYVEGDNYISRQTFPVYQVRSHRRDDGVCNIDSCTTVNSFVTVACAQYVPVHYEEPRNIRGDPCY